MIDYSLFAGHWRTLFLRVNVTTFGVLKGLIRSSALLFSGEFTPENQIRLKHEEEKEQQLARLDQWKVIDLSFAQLTFELNPSSVWEDARYK